MESFLKSKGFKISAIVLGIIAVILILNPIVIVGPTDRGIRVKLGQVQEGVLQPGLNFKIPFIEDVKMYSTVPSELDFDIKVGEGGALSSDQQNIGVATVMYWRYQESQINLAARTYSADIIQKNLSSSLPNAIKAIVGQYSITQVIPNQDKIRDKALTELRTYVKDLPIEVTQLNLKNWNWEKEYDAQVKATNELRQKVEQEKQKLDAANYSTQVQVKEAEGRKQALITEAEGAKAAAALNAEAKALEGEGVRKYNQSIFATLDTELRLRQLKIDQTRAERWNGQNVPNTQVVVPGFGTIQAK